MITPTRFALLIGILIFSSLFMSTFLWSMQSTWSWIQGTNNQFQWDVFGIIFAVVAALLIGCAIISGTHIGDKIAGLFFPTRKASMREEEKINPALEQLKVQYKDKLGQSITVNPLILDMPYINGMAYGQNTIAISTGLLKVGSDEEITAVLAHEIGHLHARDGFFNLALFTASFPTYLFHNIFKQIFALLPKPTSLPNGPDFVWLVQFMIFTMSLIILAPFIVLWVLSYPVIWIFNGLEQAVQWPIEYKADQFAADLGHSEGLISLFERIEDEDIRAETGFLAKYFHTHPPTAMRIDRLERNLKGE